MSSSSGAPTGPDTIVLIHGFWVTPRSWEQWIEHYQAQGYRVLAPAYPGLEVEVEALNADPTPLEELTLPAIIERLEEVVGGLDADPILMGIRRGAPSRSSCWTAATGRPVSLSTPRPPRACGSPRSPRSSRPGRC